MNETRISVERGENDIRTVRFGRCIVAEAAYKEPLVFLPTLDNIAPRIGQIATSFNASGVNMVGFGMVREDPVIGWPRKATISIIGVGVSLNEAPRNENLLNQKPYSLVSYQESSNAVMARCLITASAAGNWLGGRIEDESMIVLAAVVDRSVIKLGPEIRLSLGPILGQEKGFDVLIFKS